MGQRKTAGEVIQRTRQSELWQTLSLNDRTELEAQVQRAYFAGGRYVYLGLKQSVTDVFDDIRFIELVPEKDDG